MKKIAQKWRNCRLFQMDQRHDRTKTFRERNHQPLLSWRAWNFFGTIDDFFSALGYPLANFFFIVSTSHVVVPLIQCHQRHLPPWLVLTFFLVFLLFSCSQSSLTLVDHCDHGLLLVWLYILYQPKSIWQKTAHTFSTCVEFYLFVELILHGITHLPRCVQLYNASHLLHTGYHW